MDARGFWKLPGLLLAGVLLVSCASAPDDAASGPGARTLSPEEVDGLLLGKGMGMAAAAEINGYPGPGHVLALKDELELTADQRFATSRLVGLVQGQARALGQRIVNAESRLDELMAKGNASSGEMREHIQAIAGLRAQLRFVHMDAHLEQREILTPEQIRRYYEIRGREVVVPPPGSPPAPTEPLTLPMKEPAPATQVAPAPEAATPAPEQGIAPTEAGSIGAPAVPEDVAVPAAPALTPGMQDAMQEAEPAIAPAPEPVEDTPPPPGETEVPTEATVPAPVDEPTLTPGMQDAMEDAEPTITPAPKPVEDAPPLPETTEVPTQATMPAPAEEPALTPGMQDAMEDAQPSLSPPDPEPADEAKPALPLTPMEEPGAPQVTQPRALIGEPSTARQLSPGVQDAMEFAEPVGEADSEAIYIAPLEDAKIKELPPVEGEEPATIELDN